MRIETTTRKLFTFDELSDKAKDKAREWLREYQQSDTFYSDCVIEDFCHSIAPYFGWTIGKPRGSKTGHAVYFSGFWSQGDGACFEGSWNAERVDAAKLKDNCPASGGKSNATLAALMARLIDLTATVRASLVADSYKDEPSATVKQRGHYSHEGCTEFNCEGFTAEQEKTFIEISRELMRWVYRTLETEYDYQNSDEQIDESIRANEYEFTETGRIA